MSPKPRRIGIRAPSAEVNQLTISEIGVLHVNLPGFFGGLELIILPISIATQPGQQLLMIRPWFSRARTAVKAFIAALLTEYDWVGQPFWPSVP